MLRFGFLLAVLFGVLAAAESQARFVFGAGGTSIAATFFVATNGNDSNAGTLASPFLTVGKAQTAVRTALSSGIPDVTVYLRAGTYPLASTIAMTSADGTTAGHQVTWGSYLTEKAVISGGAQVTGWAICTTADTICNSGDGTTYQASVTSPSDFREFYFCPDGTLSTCLHRDRARGAAYPAGFTVNTSTGGLTAPGSGFYNGMSSWANPTHIEIVGENIWLQPRCPVATISGSPPVIALASACSSSWGFFYGQYSGSGGVGSYWPQRVENAYELLGASPCGAGSGCWYLNSTSHVLYYQPKAGENMATGMSMVPSVQGLFTGNNVANVTFNRLTFAFDSWLGPDTGGAGYIGLVSGVYCTIDGGSCNFTAGQGHSLHGALDFSGGTNAITFTNNLFAHNAARALLFEHASQNVSLLANDCEDNGGGCLQWGDNTDPTQSNAALQTAGLLARNNKMNSGGGFQYSDAGEFYQSIARNSTIDHNEIDNVGWIPIATGWGGTTNQVPASYSGNHTITNNYINGYCQGGGGGSMFDCGGIYNTAAGTGTITVDGNYVKGIGSAPNYSKGAFYPDERSANITYTNNVVDGPLTANNCILGNPNGGCSIYDWINENSFIIASGTWYSTTSKNLNLGASSSISAPTTFTSGSPPAGAIAIINAAGIQAGVTPGP